MNSNGKVAFWIATIYGAFVLIAMAPMLLFSSQQDDPLFFQLVSGAFCLTLLPSALIGIRWKKLGGAWMMLISVAAACALCLNEIQRSRPTGNRLVLGFSLLWWTTACSIPAICGFVLFTARRRKKATVRQ